MSGFDFLSQPTQNAKMKEAIETGASVANSPSHILIVGESGTGKTAFARWVHQLSRLDKPLRTVTAKELRERLQSLVESLNEAKDGTLIVEDVDQLSEPSQQILFELLEDRFASAARVRVICTSRRDLRALVRSSQFRQDLYYLLTVITINIPNLGERNEDMDSMFRFIMDVHGILQGKQNLKLDGEALELLKSWSWPGNIRELENVIERAVTLTNGETITKDNIQFVSTEDVEASEFGPGMSLSEVERRLILQTLELTAQNRTRAAQMLGISIRTLRNKLNEYKGEECYESLR